jgi:hypothetical protein
MNQRRIKIIVLSLISLFIIEVHAARAWHDETHLAAAQAAGYYKWYNATGADIAKIKAGSIEAYNHFFNNPLNRDVTPALVFKQIRRYNSPRHLQGHLYGAIIASLREYKSAVDEKKYAQYHLAFCVHYITDLSQPLHNIPYDDFNRKHHVVNDGTVNREVLDNVDKIKKNMYPIQLSGDKFEEDLAREIARIANLSRHLGLRLKKENRDLTKEEAYIQLGHSASLMKAVLKHLGKK